MAPPPLSRMSSTTSSIGSPATSAFSSASPSKQNISTTSRSPKDWWIVAVAKALQSDNGHRKAGTSNNNGSGKMSSADSRLVEYKNLYEELTKLKKILDIVKSEYEDSKSFEPFRRYSRLKGMIKRTVMYTKLEVLPDVTHALGTGSLVLMTAPSMSMRKQLGMAPECPKSELPERIHTLKKRISFVRGQIDILGDNYQNSKQYIIFQRYRLMKSMIKQILTNCIDLQHNYNYT